MQKLRYCFLEGIAKVGFDGDRFGARQIMKGESRLLPIQVDLDGTHYSRAFLHEQGHLGSNFYMNNLLECVERLKFLPSR